MSTRQSREELIKRGVLKEVYGKGERSPSVDGTKGGLRNVLDVQDKFFRHLYISLVLSLSLFLSLSLSLCLSLSVYLSLCMSLSPSPSLSLSGVSDGAMREEVKLENGRSPVTGSYPSDCDGAELMDGATSSLGMTPPPSTEKAPPRLVRPHRLVHSFLQAQ